MGEKTEACRALYRAGEGRYEEKKSVFLGAAAAVRSEEEALVFVEAKRKEHYDARHNCFAYVIGPGGRKQRASDDGEPQGTAGRPILDVLTGAGLTDAVLVVTRYFGGVLLGTGGLVRAYTAAAKDCLDKSVIIEKRAGIRLALTVRYTDLGSVQHLLAEEQVPVLQSSYAEDVTMEIVVPEAERPSLERLLADMTAGRAAVREIEKVFYASVDGKVLTEKRI